MKNDRLLALAAACLALAPQALNAATITIFNIIDGPGVGFNDSTPVSPVGGNNGTTLGEQRMNVFQAAANKWGATLTSSVTVRVAAAWTPLSCSASGATLGSTGSSAVSDFPNAPVGGHLYPKALANKFAGFDLDPNTYDIGTYFNINLGQANCLSGRTFYLGLDGNHGNNVDLFAVVLHELAHGLGFQTFTDGASGVRAGNIPSIWDDFLLDNTTNKTWTMMSDGERVASATNTGHLVWNGGNVTAAVPQVLSQGADPQGRALMYAPGFFLDGSSVSHYDTTLTPNQLMEFRINSDLSHEVTPPQDLTFSLLKDIGWAGGVSQPVADMTITLTHAGNFTQGQVGATYTITAKNSGVAATTGAVSVTDTVPSGLTATAISGSAWNCTQPAGPCSRSDALQPGASYPTITVTVKVAANAPSSVTNSAGVSGGGETNSANNLATDLTTILGAPALTVSSTHSGSFQQGQAGATYTVTVSNAGALAVSGNVTVTESVPSGLTLVSMSGAGWSCVTLPVCTNSAPLASGASYSPITVTVNVTAGATSPQINSVSASGGGSATATATDSTVITAAPASLSISKTHSGSFAPGQQNATYQVTVTNAPGAGTASGVVSVTESVPGGLTLVSMSGTGWTCSVLPTCTNLTPLAPGSSYSPITVKVNVAANATSPQVNSVSVSGGGSPSANTTDSTTITSTQPSLTLTKTHTGNFTQGQQNATYQVTVANAAGAGTTSGTVTVTESAPAGLTLVSMSGTGWSCPAIPACTNTAPLAAGAGYSPIIVTVNVAANATSPQINSVSVSGGGSASANTTDSTVITASAALLSISKTHTGNFSQGQQNATYQVTVANAPGAGTATGIVSVTESVPAGLTLLSMSGTGWTCAVLPTCTNSTPLAAGTAYSPITVKVNVAANATSPQVNSVSVSGGGSASANTTDSTIIAATAPSLSISKSHTGNFAQGQQNVTFQVTVTNAAGAGTTNAAVTVTESAPPGLSLVAMAGTGWICAALPTCTNSNPLAGGASYSPITVTANVAANAASPQVNQVSVSGGGSPTANASDTAVIGAVTPVLSLTAAHSGNFAQGQQNAAYQLTVSNAAGAGPVSGTVTVTESAPAGLTLVAMSGSGWTCAVLPTCITSTPLAGGASYSPITVTVNVAANAASPLVNAASVSGGGSATANASDSTIITGPSASLSIVKSHFFNFTQGQQNAAYQVAVSNAPGAGTTSGTVTVTESLPAGLTLVSMSGSGWNCAAPPTCTISAPLAPATSYPTITVTVNVAGNAASTLVNAVSVSGGGSAGANTTDSTIVTAASSALGISSTHTGNFAQGQQNATYQVVVSNAAGAGTAFGTVTVTESLPSGLTLVSMSGSGWNCAALPSCFTNTALAAGTSYPPITVTVNVAANAASPQVNSVSVSGGASLTATASDSTLIVTATAPALSIAKTHTGNFAEGQQNAAYQVTVTNASGAGSTSGTVSVTESVPPGLTLASMAGTGWNCAALPICTIGTPLAGGASYPPITVTVNVAAGATSPQLNAVTVSGGGSAAANATDSTTIAANAPVLGIVKSHSGSFAQGQQNAAYQVTVSNALNAGPSSGAVTVTESVPSGLTLLSMAGSGWTCAALPVCTNLTALAGGASYPPITVTVSVAANATSPLVNSVSVSGGGSATATANDSTVITSNPAALSVSKTHTGNFTQGQQHAVYQVTVSDAPGAGPVIGAVTLTESLPSGLTLVSMAGSGWNCTAMPVCTTTAPLAGGSSYPAVTVTVNVAANATSPQVNAVNVSGGGLPGANTADSTVIAPPVLNPAILSIVATHSGSFTQGQQNATWQITVSNASGAGTTSGDVTVSDSAPPGLTLLSMTGSGWSCASLPTCTNSAPLAAGATYPPITVTANVAANATSPAINSVTVSGGGSLSATTSDVIAVVPQALGAPAPIGANPSAGSGSSQTFTFTFADPRGYQDLGVVNILLNSALDGRNGCYLAYSQPSNVLYLVDDTGTLLLPGALLTSAGSRSNSQCAVSWGSAAVSGSGTTLTLTLSFTFTPSFAGNKLIYAAARDAAENNSGWVAVGVWTVPGAAPTGTTAVLGMNPPRGSGFGPTPFTFNFSDTKGFQDLGVENILVNDSLDGRHACYLGYARSINVLFLVNDNGDALLPGQVLNAPGSLSNSQCTVSWGSTPIVGSGNNLSLTLNMAFSASFSGTRIFFLATRDINELNNTGWQSLGTWAVQ